MEGGRTRRVRAKPNRLGSFAGETEVADALELGHEELEVEVEEAAERQSRSGRQPRRLGAPRPAPVTAEDLSRLLAAAPPLVDQLIQEDSVRCVTLVARDVVNLQLAAGGRIDLMPVWEAMACRIRNERPAWLVEVAAAAEVPEAEATGSHEAEPGPSTREEASAPPAKRPRGDCGAGAVPVQLSVLEVVQAAVAADPARHSELKKGEALWFFQLSSKNVQGIETFRGRWGAAFCCELDIRAAAHRKHGDAARVEANKAAARAAAEQRRRAQEERFARLRVEREAELSLRLQEHGVPEDAPEVTEDHALGTFKRYNLGHPDELVGRVSRAYHARVGREARKQALDQGLAAEGLGFLKSTWRYKAFVDDGLEEAVGAVLAVARRRKEESHAQLGRLLDLEDRLDAAGLSCVYQATNALFVPWVASGEGDIDGLVGGLAAHLHRQAELLAALRAAGLLYRREAHRCRRYIEGAAPLASAASVVESLQRSLRRQHKRCQQLLRRLAAEQLPPHVSPCEAQAFVKGHGDLEAAVAAVRDVFHSASSE